MFALIRKLFRDCTTERDGKTFCPARVAGFASAISTTAAYVFDSTWTVVHHGGFDAQQFGIGAAAIIGAVGALAGGIAVKAKTESDSDSAQ